jgi:hypothetical protein
LPVHYLPLNIPNIAVAGDLPPPPKDINEINHMEFYKIYKKTVDVDYEHFKIDLYVDYFMI